MGSKPWLACACERSRRPRAPGEKASADLNVESISRTVTYTGELSALIRVIPRGKRLNTPRLDIIPGNVHGTSVVQLSSCPVVTLSLYLASVRYLVPYVLDAHDELYIKYVCLYISSPYITPT